MGLGKTAQSIAVMSWLRQFGKVKLPFGVTHVHIHMQPAIIQTQMGLGKTAQSIAVMSWLRQFGKVKLPFLVVAPLTTLGHWQREIETWTDMVGCMLTVPLYCSAHRVHS